ncbi:hypothetical protein [Achromobacter pestifer]
MSKSKIPFRPAQAGYSAAFGDGTESIQLAGGSGRYRAGVQGNSDTVNASWVLVGDDYSAFMGFVRNYWREGPQSFLIDLSLDSHEMEEYEAYFVPRTLKLVSRQGRTYTVSSSLEVLALAKFEDADLDYWGSLIMLLVIYGSIPAAREILNLLAKLVNEDLPHG